MISKWEQKRADELKRLENLSVDERNAELKAAASQLLDELVKSEENNIKWDDENVIAHIAFSHLTGLIQKFSLIENPVPKSLYGDDCYTTSYTAAMNGGSSDMTIKLFPKCVTLTDQKYAINASVLISGACNIIYRKPPTLFNPEIRYYDIGNLGFTLENLKTLDRGFGEVMLGNSMYHRHPKRQHFINLRDNLKKIYFCSNELSSFGLNKNIEDLQANFEATTLLLSESDTITPEQRKKIKSTLGIEVIDEHFRPIEIDLTKDGSGLVEGAEALLNQLKDAYRSWIINIKDTCERLINEKQALLNENQISKESDAFVPNF